MLRRLLGDATEAFLSDQYLKAPGVFRGSAAPSVRGLVTPSVLEALLGQAAADVLVVRGGKPREGDRPVTLEAARGLLAEGYTLAFRDPNHHDEELRDLSRSLAADLHAWPNVHLYWTPPGQQGFTWHFDPEEVFIVQLSGRKEYRARADRQQNPTEDVMGDTRAPAGDDADAQAWVLEPGDCLYLPGGLWHSARAVDESLSLSFGMMPATLVDALDYVRRLLVQSPLWRRRLAPLGRKSPLDDGAQLALCQTLFSELATELSATLTSPQFTLQFLADSARTFSQQQPPARIAPARLPRR